MDKILDLVPLKNRLASDAKYQEIMECLMEKLKKFNDVKYKTNPELILHIITIIENTVVKKDRIDKLQLACDIYSQLFNITDKSEIDAFCGIVHFLLDNKQVKKITTMKYAMKWVNGFF